MIFFRERGRFPSALSEVETDLVTLGRQIDVPVPTSTDWDVAEHTAKRLRSEIRALYGFREASVADADALVDWLRNQPAAQAGGPLPALLAVLEARCRELSIEPPTAECTDR